MRSGSGPRSAAQPSPRFPPQARWETIAGDAIHAYIIWRDVALPKRPEVQTQLWFPFALDKVTF
jgi:hypothetical protein